MSVAWSRRDPVTTFCLGGFPTCSFPATVLHCPHLKPWGGGEARGFSESEGSRRRRVNET